MYMNYGEFCKAYSLNEDKESLVIWLAYSASYLKRYREVK